MNVAGIQFSAVRRLLEEHGYLLSKIQGSHRVFVHADKSKPVIMIPLRDRGVSPAHVQAIRRIMDETRVISPEEFDAAITRAKAG